MECFPARVVGVETAEGQGEFVQDAHRKGAGADGGVKDFDFGNGLDDVVSLRRGEEVFGRRRRSRCSPGGSGCVVASGWWGRHQWPVARDQWSVGGVSARGGRRRWVGWVVSDR